MRTTTIFTNDSTQTSTQCQWHDNDRVGRMEWMRDERTLHHDERIDAHALILAEADLKRQAASCLVSTISTTRTMNAMRDQFAFEHETYALKEQRRNKKQKRRRPMKRSSTTMNADDILMDIEFERGFDMDDDYMMNYASETARIAWPRGRRSSEWISLTR